MTTGGVLIGERVRRLRKERGLSQEAVARRTGVGLKAYGDLERGRTHDPHYSTLRDIAAALGVPVTELLSEEVTGEPVPLDKAPRRSGSQELADAADELLILGHHLLETWESELPNRAEAGDDEWLGNISATWTLFSQINYKVLKAVGPHGLNNLEGWSAKYMDVNATIRRLNEAISEHSEEDVVKLEPLVGA